MSSMSLAMKARQKVRKNKTAKDRVFGCDLLEHLQFTGQEVPQVLKSCTEFIEHHGIVDGIYRLSGISSNIQKLRQEFDIERSPDLTKEIYLQDIHCVSSLCKAYFRELPNPLLTYQLYDKFAEAVAIQLEEARLVKIKEVLKELPPPHYRTLEFLMKHLVHMASFSSETNMHARNLAIVWAPNLLRSKDIEASGFNGTAAFMEVRIQSIVVEFILTHVEQLFQDAPLSVGENESYRRAFPLAGTSGSLPAKTQDEFYFRSLSYNIPSILNQGDGPPLIRPYHTIIDIADQKRKGSLKGKKWKSIFNLGRSNNDSKRKSTKQDEKDDKSRKISLRPAKSMDSLSAMPYANEDKGVLGSKGSHKIHIPLRRESFDKPSKQEASQSFQESNLLSQSQNEDSIDTDSEPTAKSEPTTPKPSRATLTTNPQGRSPNANRNRAEKCAGVHISGPFSVTVPFHITSNLTLSRLTRGLECPALSNSLVDREELEALNLQESGTLHHKSGEVAKAELQKHGAKEDSINDKHKKLHLRSAKSMDSLSPVPYNKDVDQMKEESLEDAENCRLSLEVQDSFSFLDSQDTNAEVGCSEEDRGAHCPANDHLPSLTEDEILSFPSEHQMSCFPIDLERVDEDFGSSYLNDIMVSDMQVAEFSVEPPADDMCSEDECDQQFFDPTGCLDNEDHPREEEEYSEDVFLSAYDDLSPIMKDLKPLSKLLEGHDSHRPEAEEELDVNWTSPSELLSGTLEEVESVAASDNLLPDVEASTIEMPSQSPNECLKHGLETIDSCLSDERTVGPKSVPNHLEESALCNDNNSIIGIPLATLHIDEAHKEEKEGPANEINCSSHSADADSATTWDTFVIVDTPATDQKKDIPLRESDYQHDVAILELDKLVQALNELGDEAGLSTQSRIYDAVDGIPKYRRPSAHAIESVNAVPEKTTSVLEGAVPHLKREVEQPFQGTYEGMHFRSMAPNYSPEAQENKKPPRFYSDGSASMRLISTFAHIQQVKSLPVVPPKPLFAKLPPELKSKIHIGAASTGNRNAGESQSLKHGKPEKCHSIDLSFPSAGSPQKQQRSSWRDGGSVSFDTGTAHAKDRQMYQLPIRRMQTYSIGDSHESHDTSKAHVPRLNLKPHRLRSSRPVSCLGSPTSPKEVNLETDLCQEAPASLGFESRLKSSQESFTASQECSMYNRLSLPRIGQRLDSEEKGACLHQQRRSIV